MVKGMTWCHVEPVVLPIKLVSSQQHVACKWQIQEHHLATTAAMATKGLGISQEGCMRAGFKIWIFIKSEVFLQHLETLLSKANMPR